MANGVKYSIQPSAIHGLGAIAIAPIQRGETIGVIVTISDNGPSITDELGKYINHSNNANCRIVWNNGNYDLVATTIIAPNEEITGNYYDTPWFLEKPKEGYV